MPSRRWLTSMGLNFWSDRSLKEVDMKEKTNIIAMVPARIGSTRLKMKNLALINGKPLISYAIDAAKASGVFSRVVVNSDNEIFAGVAERYGADFYLRP